MTSGIPDLYTLDASSALPAVTTQNVSGYCQMPRGVAESFPRRNCGWLRGWHEKCPGTNQRKSGPQCDIHGSFLPPFPVCLMGIMAAQQQHRSRCEGEERTLRQGRHLTEAALLFANLPEMLQHLMALTQVLKVAQTVVLPPGLFLMLALIQIFHFTATKRKSPLIHTRC